MTWSYFIYLHSRSHDLCRDLQVQVLVRFWNLGLSQLVQKPDEIMDERDFFKESLEVIFKLGNVGSLQLLRIHWMNIREHSPKIISVGWNGMAWWHGPVGKETSFQSAWKKWYCSILQQTLLQTLCTTIYRVKNLLHQQWYFKWKLWKQCAFTMILLLGKHTGYNHDLAFKTCNTQAFVWNILTLFCRTTFRFNCLSNPCKECKCPKTPQAEFVLQISFCCGIRVFHQLLQLPPIYFIMAALNYS